MKIIYRIVIEVYQHQENNFFIDTFNIEKETNKYLFARKKELICIQKEGTEGLVLNRCNMSSIQGCDELSGIFYEVWFNDSFRISSVIEHFELYEQYLKDNFEGDYIPVVEFRKYLTNLFIFEQLADAA